MGGWGSSEGPDFLRRENGRFKSQVLKPANRYKWLRLFRMGYKHLFHPDHIPPLAQFIAAFGEMAHGAVAVFFVKGNAVRIGVGNAGVDVDDILAFQIVFQCLIENGARAGAPCVFGHIDGGLHSPVIGGPLLKFRCIGISQDASVPNCSQIRVPLQGGGDTVLKLLDSRHLIFKGDGCLFHIGCVYGQKGFCVCFLRHADGDGCV